MVKKKTNESNFVTGKTGAETTNDSKYFIDKSEEKKDIKEKSWYIFVISFLINAKNECDFLINSKRLDDNNKYLVISIVYNFKHGLEVFLKAFSRFLNEKIDKGDYGHDTKRLLDSFKNQINKKKGKTKLKNKKQTDKDINDLEKIIEKYNEIDFFKNYIKESFSVYDTENTFFKYPEHSTKIIIDYSRLSNQVNREDLKKIKKDIETVLKISKKFKSTLL
ncbi:hypothetical protein L6261_01905 [Candidatus Parcubacteria bacterium]|nr:hypothetical protein [Candidatus Parcubacteria bacterium]